MPRSQVAGLPELLSARMDSQLSAQIRMRGTGNERSQPAIKMVFRPFLSHRFPAKKLVIAFVIPKMTMKDKIAVLASSKNSFSPISGIRLRSIPMMAPTKILIIMRRMN